MPLRRWQKDADILLTPCDEPAVYILEDVRPVVYRQRVTASHQLPSERPDRRQRTHRERFEALPPERQAQLLDPAEAEFAEHGYERASLNHILERAGISKGQAYHYARDKAALYCLVVERALNRIAESVGSIALKKGSPEIFWTSLATVVMRGTAMLAGEPRLAELARGIYSGSAPRPALAPLVARVEGWLGQAIEAGQQAGAVRTDIPSGLLVAVTLGATLQADRWFADHWTELDADEVLERTKEVLDLCRSMLSPQSRKME